MAASVVHLRERIARHGLADRPAGTVVAAVARTTALQAQDNLAGRLGVRARATGVTDADVRRALDEERTVARTWLLRGTIHLVPAADLPWLVRLVGPAVARKYATRWRQLGLTEQVLERTAPAIGELVSGGPLTRAEIWSGLAERGLAVDSEDPQVSVHVVVHASCVGRICRGPDRGRESTFVNIAEWLPGAPAGPSGDEALAELARRYFAAYSPATAADFTTWSGLASGRAIELIRDELTAVELAGRPAYRLGEVPPASGVRLLPAFDNYLLGYKERSGYVPPERHREVFDGGIIRSVVLADGRVVGRWTLDRVRGRVRLDPWAEWPAAVWRAVQREVADLGRFLGREVAMER